MQQRLGSLKEQLDLPPYPLRLEYLQRRGSRLVTAPHQSAGFPRRDIQIGMQQCEYIGPLCLDM